MYYAFILIVLLLTITPSLASTRLPYSFSGRCIQLDPGFAYYQNRSPESIVEEVKAQGYDSVCFIVTAESAINGDLVKALHKAKVPARMMTFGNGVYSTRDLPQGWERWKMVLRKNQHTAAGFTHLCPNNPAYRKWKKAHLSAAINKHGFKGLDICESFFPAYGGPEKETYGCLCGSCKASFKRMYPDEKDIPEFNDENSPRYWKTDIALYKKWVEFRVASVANFYDDIINGPGGIRKSCPGVAVCTWTLAADIPNAVETMREWEGLDAAAVVSRVRPDAHCLQTDWPDWIRAELPADYPKLYTPFIDHLRKVDKNIPITLQIDIGSQTQMRRDSEWIAKCEKTAKDMGFCQVLGYEFHLSLDIYTKAPRLIRAKMNGDNTIRLVFDKRLDSKTVSDPKNYSLSAGEVVSAKCDGCLVNLEVKGAKRGGKVTVLSCADDPTVRFWKDHPEKNTATNLSCVITN